MTTALTLQHLDSTSLAMGPAQILQLVENTFLGSATEYSSGYILNRMFRGFLSEPISKILERREVEMPNAKESSHWQSILDDINGESDLCMS